ncbi:MAG: hypothetical protein ACJAX5_002079 [Patiriisocius sp.]|jgi:hypothetical protein
MKVQYLIVAVVLLTSYGVWAEEELPELTQNVSQVDFDSILDSIDGTVEERTTTGTIGRIDLSGRTAIIDGILYHFGPSTDQAPLKVRLLGRDFGALEMLSVGMDVEVIYFKGPAGDRIGNVLNQIASSDQH